MKNVLIIITFGMLLFACKKESAIESNIVLENIYEIADGTNPVQHRRYEIFKKYGVSIYFNDTVNVTETGVDYFGKPIYTVEKLDINWKFDSYSDTNLKYDYIDVNSVEGQKEANEVIDYVENYLSTSSKAIYPLTILGVKSVKSVDDRGNESIIEKGSYAVHFRTLLVTNNWEITKEEFTKSVRLDIVRKKIGNFKQDVLMLEGISKKEWYDVFWSDLSTTFPKGFSDTGVEYEKWWIDWRKSLGETDEQIEETISEKRRLMGSYGFVSGSKMTGYDTPWNLDEDVDSFLGQMLRRSKDEFFNIYKESPLVIKKAQILYDILETKIGLKL